MIDFRKYFIVGTNDAGLRDTMNGMVTGELIRCKDCKWNKSDKWVDCPITEMFGRTTDNYCSRAERKEE